DGALIPAIYLVNGRSITQCAPEGADSIEYLHIQLFAHDVIYAEGARAETFFAAAGVRDRFENFAEYQRLYSNENESVHPECAPRLYGQPPRFDRSLRPLRSLLEPWIDLRVTEVKIRDRLAVRARELAC